MRSLRLTLFLAVVLVLTISVESKKEGKLSSTKSLRFELWDSDFFPGYDDDLIVVQECIYPYRCILRGGYDDGLWDYNQEFYIKIRIECHNQTNVRLDMLQNVYFLDQLDNRNPITLCPDGAKLKKEKKIY